MKILVIDNYDSFTYNLVQLVGLFTKDIVVVRNDKIDYKGILKISPDKILISPGPGRPEDSGASLIALNNFAGIVPILGVCLGHQAIGLTFGGKVIKAGEIMHGKVSPIKHNGESIFTGLSQNFLATRYHSLIIERESLPNCLEITAETESGMIMGVRHRRLPIEGVQFHPESILTTEGAKMIDNWLRM